MEFIRKGIIQYSLPNNAGYSCTDCSDIAHRLMIVLIDGISHEVPLCAKHYMEACDTQPVIGYVVRSSDRSALRLVERICEPAFSDLWNRRYAK